ncbi:LysR family transcriptional regulator, partial [Gammaproteobacteria bacterium]|nr:LysR family transcriptional regulator [Gammaproteobacteria bacterium]
MFRQLPPLKSLRAFEVAARLGSFTDAAKELALTQGAISYQIKLLESSLGIELFVRSTRQVSLTDAGHSLFRTTHRLFRELEDEIHSLAPGKDSSVLTVSVSTYFVTRWLSKRLGKFINKYPQITIRLQHSVNDPDFTLEEVDLAIQWGTGNDSQSELLIASPMIALCAPQLLDAGLDTTDFDSLRQQTFLHDQESNDGWVEWLEMAGLGDLGAGSGPVILDPNVRVQSAIDGHGLVLANILLCEDIAAGRLLEPYNVRLEGYGFHLLYAESIKKGSAFLLFRQWLLDEAEV